jgi:hypothetical protein
MWAGSWLDEDALRLEEYGAVTRSNAGPIDYPTAYRLAGIDPARFLLVKTGLPSSNREPGAYWVLVRNSEENYGRMCDYGDAADRYAPRECKRAWQ